MIQAEYPLLFLDVETTGHDVLKPVSFLKIFFGINLFVLWHEIIDIGAVAVNPATCDVLGEFEIKIHPCHPERCLPDLINNYRERSAKGEWHSAVSLSEAIRRLLNFCDEMRKFNGNVPVLIGQNFFFDWNFLAAAFAYCGIKEREWRKDLHYSRLDTRSMAVQEFLGYGEPYNPDDFSLRNDRLAAKLGLPDEPKPHLAINGAYQSYKVFKALREISSGR